MPMAFKNYALILLLPLLALSGCGDKTPQEALTLLEANQFSEAQALAKKALEDKPKDPFFHGVMAEVFTEQCVRSNCPASEPEMLDKIRSHLGHISKPITLDEGRSFNIYARIAPIAERFISVHNSTESYATFVSKALPEGANKRHFLREIETFAQRAMQRGDVNEAVSLLGNVVALGNPESPTVKLSKFMLQFIQTNGASSPEAQAQVTEVLENNPNEEETFIRNIPQLALVKAKGEEGENKTLLNAYTEILEAPFDAMGLKKFDTAQNRARLAGEIFELSKDSGFLERITQGLENGQGKARAALLKTALLHDTTNAEIWNIFFPLALESTQAGASLRFIYNNIDLTKIPADVVIRNNELLLEKAESALQESVDISPYLQEIIYRRDAEQANFDERVNVMLDRALDRALKQKDYKKAVTYLRLIPEPPEDKRERLLDILEEALVVFWADDAFQRMEEITQYMRSSLNASINLDVELMGLLRTYLESDEVKDKLRATTPEPLLLSAEEARVDLGPKMDYAQKRFSQRPEIIQARLKALAINLEGAYSTANVLHSLRHLFTDENLDELVTNALKSAMVNDENLSAVEMATYSLAFQKKWPEFFAINFIVGESLKRIKDVDEAQQVWKETNQEFHNFAGKLRPQMVSLLDGIELFEKGERTKAAAVFARITDPVYRKEAQPYLEQYDSLVRPFKGTYIYQGEAHESPVAALYIKEGDKLLEADVTAISHLGVMEREQELIIDRGQVSRISFTADYASETGRLRVQNIDDVISGLTTNEARTFGKLSYFTKEGDTLLLHLTSGQAYPFIRANASPGYAPLPKGSYAILETVHDAGTQSSALPIGSIINIQTDRQTVRQDIEDPILGVILTKSVHSVSGTIRHPATADEIALSGFYDKNTLMVHLEYTYPMNNGQTIYNALTRCQPLEARITCAAHNRHEKRKRFMTVVTGRKAK